MFAVGVVEINYWSLESFGGFLHAHCLREMGGSSNWLGATKNENENIDFIDDDLGNLEDKVDKVITSG